MVLLVCASIFSLALGLIIGLEDLGSFSYSFAAGWMLWCWHAEWPACKKKELKVSFRLSQKHEPPGGGGGNKAWCHQRKIEVWVTNISAHNGWNVCVCEDVRTCSFPSVLCRLASCRPASTPPTPPHFNAARGSKLYYCKQHHAVKCSPSDSSPHCRLIVSLLKSNVGHLLTQVRRTHPISSSSFREHWLCLWL